MKIVRAKKLEKGNTIGIIALSGVIKNKDNILNAKKYFEKMGYKVVLSGNIFEKNHYLAGDDETKIKELHKFFKSKDINAILCARGGYGALRIVDKIDYEVIKNNPKIFAGYSDETVFESMIYKKTGLITFYAPMAHGDFGGGEVPKSTEKSFFKTLTNTGRLILEPCKRKSKTYFEGEAEGVLWGGNLASVVSLCGGEDFVPDEKFVFFAEDLNEEAYKIDKMMTQLLRVKKFRENLSGIILGDFLDVSYKKSFDKLFLELGKELRIPILSGFKITHDKNKDTVPYGVKCKFSTETKILETEKYLVD